MAKIKNLTDIPSIAKYLVRIGAEPRSLRTAIVRENSGAYWRDIAIIHFNMDGTVKAPTGFEPLESEQSLMKAECANVTWPRPVKLASIDGGLPQVLNDTDPDNLFVFKDISGNIIMLHQRVENKEGGKNYIPWTYWDDGEWRRMEPEGKLPLYGLEQLKDHAVAFIHEGAKAARAMRELVEDKSPEGKARLKSFPWGEEVTYAAHLGWIGGALSPARTDWGALRQQGIKRVYIVSDNDEAGVAAVPSISYYVRLPAYHVQFTNEWPASFDLADEWPAKMFKEIKGKRYYNGPSFRSVLHPATWATDQVPSPSGKGRPTTVLREEFKNFWVYVEEADLFVCKEMPDILRTEPVLNKMLAGFSHSSQTASLIVKSYRGRQTKLCYRPDIKGRMVTDRTTSAINMHMPTHVKSRSGDITPWLEFVNYLCVNPNEAKELLKWCATLIGRPDIRMEYGVLLISEMQGIGKTTLGEKILMPLLGETNVGFPTEDDITNSPFNGWVANKRLVIVGEIYAGQSWKAYNRLKSYITDKVVEVNQKYMRPYRHENWVHVLASSNSRKALRMEQNDRRWFYPQLAEVPWPKEKFVEFLEWLNGGGLQIIKYWAERYGDYVLPGIRAPMTELKKAMIKDSRSSAQIELADLCEAVVSEGMTVAFAMKEIVIWLKNAVSKQIYDSDLELRKTALEMGLVLFEERVKVGSQMQYILMSPRLADLVRGLTEPGERREVLKKHLRSPHDLGAGTM